MSRSGMHAGDAATVALGLLGIFVLPWFVPPLRPVYSASYALGFNNAVASLAFAALLGALLVRRLRRPVGAGERIVAGMLHAPAPRKTPWSALVALVVMTVLTAAILVVWYAIMPSSQYGEYHLDVSHLDQMTLGLRPHRDFHYIYGPGMLYPAHWLYTLCGGRLSIDVAFLATLVAHWAGGLMLLFYVVQTLCTGRRAAVVFVCVSLAVFNLSMGVGYTPMRFMPPIASLLFLHRRFCRWLDADHVGLLKPGAIALLLCLGSSSLSPEIGVATAAGTATFFVALFFTPLRRLSLAALAPVLALGISVLVFSKDYTEGIFSFGSGANTLPVLPTIAIVFYVAAGSVVVPFLGAIGVRERNPDGALAFALVVAAGVLLPAAFGRCDQGHVLFNGLGVLILFLGLTVQLPSRAAAALSVAAFLGAYPMVYSLAAYTDSGIRNAIENRRALRRAKFDERKNEKVWYAVSGTSGNLRYGKLPPFQEGLRQLLAYEKVATPFGAVEDVNRFLKLSGRFFPEYYYAGASVPSQVDRKLRDLGAMETLLVLKGHRRRPILTDESNPRWLSSVLCFPERLIPGPRRDPYLPGVEIMKHITEDFSVVGELRTFNITYEIWRRKSR